MSSKLQYQVFFGEDSVGYGPNGIDLSAFKCTQSGIDKPQDRSFGSIYKWLERGFHINPETRVSRRGTFHDFSSISNPHSPISPFAPIGVHPLPNNIYIPKK